MTGADVQAFRARFGLSRPQLAALLRMRGEHAATTVRRWEQEAQDIPALAEAVMAMAVAIPAVRRWLGLLAAPVRRAGN